MSQNIGTLITSAIRPNDSLDLIASAFANEIKGGFHTATASSDRNSIIEARREWGMICYVINDNVTYQLVYSHVDTNISNNDNWVIYSPSSNTIEWVDSVIRVETDTTNITSFNDDDRYLIAGVGVGLFTGYDNKIAYWDTAYTGGPGASGWRFITPTTGTSLRSDAEKNIVYKWNGISWRREVTNEVRYISPTTVNNIDYTFTTTGQEVLQDYSVFFLANFDAGNSGAATLNVDGIGQKTLKKVNNGLLIDLVAGDIIPGIEYKIFWNSNQDFLQLDLPASSVGVIGNAEDGDYTDGLYTDFTTSTPIGTAVDRFNEVLKALVPPSAPTLSSWSAVTTQFISGGLSFDNGTPGGGFVSATGSPYGAVAAGGSFNTSGYRLGITSKVLQPLTGTTYYQDITGVLNSAVPLSTSTPTPAYAANSFGYATTGTMSLIFNGLTLSTISLGSTISAIDTTNGGATSGISLSAATSSKFPSGFPFELFYNRTGTYRIKRDSGAMVDGYNYLIVRHDVNGSSYVLNRYEFVADSNISITTFTSPRINNIVTFGTKYLSGVKYYSSMTLKYLVTINNVYGNTFNTGNAITFVDGSTSLATNGVYTGNTNGSQNVLVPIPSYYSLPTSGVTPVDNWTVQGTGWTFSFASNKRLLNNPLKIATTVLRTVQGTVTGGTALGTAISVNNWFVDTVNPTSTNLSEGFDDETYRILNLSTKYATASNSWSNIPVSGNTTYAWISSASLNTDTNHKNGLQVINSQLVYPNFNYTTHGTLDTNPNFGLTPGLEYNNCYTTTTGLGISDITTSNYRTYTRYFNVGTSTNYSNLKINISWSSTSFVNANQLLSGNGMWVEVKLPYKSGTGTPPAGINNGSVTGWLDATKAFVNGQYTDGSGCLVGSIPTSSGNDWNVTFGYQGTQYSGGIILIRVTAPSSWVGAIDSISVQGV